MSDSTRSISVAICSGGIAVPKLMLSLERVDATGAASFVAAVADMLAQELAVRDGLSFDHPLANSIGALSGESVESLSAAVEATKDHESSNRL